MSQANVEIVRKGYEALNAGGVEAALAFHAEDVLIYPTSEWPDDDVYRGHDGLRRLYHAWTGNFDDWRWEVQEIQDVGSRVLSLVEMKGRMKDSGLPISEAWGVVASDFRDGTVGEVRLFRSQRQALEAVGLAE
jgi:ketosteroid isomerase-like protein